MACPTPRQAGSESLNAGCSSLRKETCYTVGIFEKLDTLLTSDFLNQPLVGVCASSGVPSLTTLLLTCLLDFRNKCSTVLKTSCKLMGLLCTDGVCRLCPFCMSDRCLTEALHSVLLPRKITQHTLNTCCVRVPCGLKMALNFWAPGCIAVHRAGT